MKRLTFILTIIVGFSWGCNLKNSRTNSNSQIVSESKIIEKLKDNKTNIDTLFNRNKNKLIVFVKLAGKVKPIQMKDGNSQNNIETTFNILKNSSGQIIAASEIPFSESGDWYIAYIQYFDKNGRTFAFERQTNFFNSLCTNGVAYETVTKYYNNNFKMIDSTYKLVDKNGKSLKRDSCQFPYDYKYMVTKNIEEYLKDKKIKNGS